MISGVAAIHLAMGLGLLALVVVILALALPAALRGQAPPALYRPLHRAVAGLVLAQVVVGVLLLLVGRRPHTNLHLIYAVAAILVMPVARSIVRHDRGRARLIQLGGTLLLLGVLFRLATTG